MIRKKYIKPQTNIVASVPCTLCAGSGYDNLWVIDKDENHNPDKDDYGKIIYDDGSLQGSHYDPYNDSNW